MDLSRTPDLSAALEATIEAAFLHPFKVLMEFIEQLIAAIRFDVGDLLDEVRPQDSL